ncbi:MAG: transglycosylase SLT domain-containing protein [Brachymonas sp.]|nr:transglycosylase SLT domain-containing protein [Brachymonas sp.]
MQHQRPSHRRSSLSSSVSAAPTRHAARRRGNSTNHRSAIRRRLQLIVTWLGLCLVPTAHTQTGPAAASSLSTPEQSAPAAPIQATPSQPRAADDVLLEMARAFRNRDSAALTAWLPQASGHPLEPWAAYWELNARLPSASPAEVDAFLQRYAGSYQEDRLRNDWLLQLGQSASQTGDWPSFAQSFARYYPAFRMRDDHTVRCYAILAAEPLNISREEALLMLREAWFSRKGGGSACPQAAAKLYAQGALHLDTIWRKARHAAERRQTDAARQAVAIVDGAAAAQVPALFAKPQAHLDSADLASPNSAISRELAVLAAARLAVQDPAAAAQWLQGPAAQALSAPQRDWLWASIGRQAALNLDVQAPAHFARVQDLRLLDDEQLGWMARSALRLGQWAQVRHAIEAMSPFAQQEPVWTYWLARSLQNGQQRPAQRPAQAQALLARIASHHGFYEMLALEELHGRIDPAPSTRAPSAQELAAARANPSIQRAFVARELGLNSEATREWNYATSLHLRGGMNDRDLLATAELACQQQWWDRCINTSKRTRQALHVAQRFPMPYRDHIMGWSQQNGLDPAWVLGLIRQESRFATQARSGAGASGLMQVMPGTARLVARKLGIATPALNGIDGNLQLGTSYLAGLQAEFDSALLSSAGYNAGPGRPRRWREGPVLEGAIWAENVPFAETRDYVKRVLANSVNYALLLTPGQTQSLYARLGTVRPAPVEMAPVPNATVGNPIESGESGNAAGRLSAPAGSEE